MHSLLLHSLLLHSLLLHSLLSNAFFVIAFFVIAFFVIAFFVIAFFVIKCILCYCIICHCILCHCIICYCILCYQFIKCILCYCSRTHFQGRRPSERLPSRAGGGVGTWLRGFFSSFPETSYLNTICLSWTTKVMFKLINRIDSSFFQIHLREHGNCSLFHEHGYSM